MKIYDTLKMKLGERSYNITVGCDILSEAKNLFNLDRRVLIVTDSGVPKEYAVAISRCCKESKIISFISGEESKNLSTYAAICKQMLSFGLKRNDAVVAVGGGVVGDICAFCAATYMRGIDFYNVPTTLLSQVDSSIGGKCGVDFEGVKNILGAFYQPKGVLIDVATLKTLDKRQFSAGAAEIIKMALTSDAELFEVIEAEGINENNISGIIISALKIKKYVVERDEKESGLRKILNFGHTMGHGIEALGGFLHGECVALGMIPMCDERVRKRLIPLLITLGLPTKFSGNAERALEFIAHDKKGFFGKLDTVYVKSPGEYEIRKLSCEDISSLFSLI